MEIDGRTQIRGQEVRQPRTAGMDCGQRDRDRNWRNHTLVRVSRSGSGDFVLSGFGTGAVSCMAPGSKRFFPVSHVSHSLTHSLQPKLSKSMSMSMRTKSFG